MTATLITFIQTLPQIVSLLKDMWAYLNKISGNDPAAYVARVGAAFSALSAAQTQGDHANAAKALADALAHQPTSK